MRGQGGPRGGPNEAAEEESRMTESPQIRAARPPTLLARGLVRHCPRCGQGRLFTGWFTPPTPCPRCGQTFNRDNDAAVGWIIVNLGITEIAFVASALAVLVLTWPSVPWTGLTIAAVAVNATLPLLLVP